MTLKEDRAEVERVAVSWQDAPESDLEAMMTRLGKMLEYLDSSEVAEYRLRHDIERLMEQIEAVLGQGPEMHD